MLAAGIKVVAYDTSSAAMDAAAKLGCDVVDSPRAVGEASPMVLSILPNDAVLCEVTHAEDGILAGLQRGSGIHVSCSTVSPHTSRELAALHTDAGAIFVGAPVFARPDGVAAKNGTWMLSGPAAGVAAATEVLETTCSGVYEFGEDPGAANVVKLSGNFMISAAVEAMGEALALSESNGLDREKVMGMLSDTIFNCLIYKGYGNRVAARKHFQDVEHPGFGLELGLKDIALVLDTAKTSPTPVPMPFASVLHNRLTTSKNRGWGELDWSAIGLSISEDAGVDISDAANNPRPE
jgi:3-hydroxyisobutyrate dehydrogenase-like beta-hydroxyacid dehydrogenase